MKLKVIALILCFVLVLGCFTGCGKKTSEEEQVTEVTEETSTETTTLAITTQTTTVVTTETTTVKTSAINHHLTRQQSLQVEVQVKSILL